MKLSLMSSLVMRICPKGFSEFNPLFAQCYNWLWIEYAFAIPSSLNNVKTTVNYYLVFNHHLELLNVEHIKFKYAYRDKREGDNYCKLINNSPGPQFHFTEYLKTRLEVMRDNQQLLLQVLETSFVNSWNNVQPIAFKHLLPERFIYVFSF